MYYSCLSSHTCIQHRCTSLNCETCDRYCMCVLKATESWLWISTWSGHSHLSAWCHACLLSTWKGRALLRWPLRNYTQMGVRQSTWCEWHQGNLDHFGRIIVSESEGPSPSVSLKLMKTWGSPSTMHWPSLKTCGPHCDWGNSIRTTGSPTGFWTEWLVAATTAKSSSSKNPSGCKSSPIYHAVLWSSHSYRAFLWTTGQVLCMHDAMTMSRTQESLGQNPLAGVGIFHPSQGCKISRSDGNKQPPLPFDMKICTTFSHQTIAFQGMVGTPLWSLHFTFSEIEHTPWGRNSWGRWQSRWREPTRYKSRFHALIRFSILHSLSQGRGDGQRFWPVRRHGCYRSS